MCASHRRLKRDSLGMQTTISLKKVRRTAIKTAKARKCKTNKTRPLSWALSGVRMQCGHHQWPPRNASRKVNSPCFGCETDQTSKNFPRRNALEIGQTLHSQSPSQLAMWCVARMARAACSTNTAFPISLQQQKLPRYHKNPSKGPFPRKERAGVSPVNMPFFIHTFRVHV